MTRKKVKILYGVNMGHPGSVVGKGYRHYETE